MDFTLKSYRNLIEALVKANYNFQTLSDYLEEPKTKSILLRHDVEKKYPNALEFARIQNSFNIKGTYYFRILENHYNEDIISQISGLNHEIGYHYDDLSYCKGDYNVAIERFKSNLSKLRNIAPVRSICMEGAPLSKYDNRNIWKKYNFKDFGILGEPYFSLNFDEILYLTDTGRNWSGRFSVRDKTSENKNNIKLICNTTKDIILAAKQGNLPDKVMITFHPQRWNDNLLPWMKELVMQNIKNQVKRYYVKSN